MEKIIIKNQELNFFNIHKICRAFHLDYSLLSYYQKMILISVVSNTYFRKISDNDFIQNCKNIIDGEREIPVFPTNILLEDNAGLPLLVEMATMKDIYAKEGLDTHSLNISIQTNLTIDHTMQVDFYKHKHSMPLNEKNDLERNYERYKFLGWCKENFQLLNVLPPNTGISHQLHLEHLSNVLLKQTFDGKVFLLPEIYIGSDSHTPMINSLGILGWGAGGIEVTSLLLGNPFNLIKPSVVGIELTGIKKEGVTTTDIVLKLTEFLRSTNISGKSLEFFGEGVFNLDLEDRATIANMCPEYGATGAIFPFDEKTVKYLSDTGRDLELIETINLYFKKQGIFGQSTSCYKEQLVFDISAVRPSISGPKSPDQNIPLDEVCLPFRDKIKKGSSNNKLKEGSVVIAAITSCTNTGNPKNMLTAGLLAQKAVNLGLQVPEYVKTSLAPGSRTIASYLESVNLLTPLEQLGFKLVGFGCSTCAGSGGDLDSELLKEINENSLEVATIISGNRNFSGRTHSQIMYNYLASPALVVVYAIVGSMDINLLEDHIGNDLTGNKIYLKDIWPTNEEIENLHTLIREKGLFKTNLDKQDFKFWDSIKIPSGKCYPWNPDSLYLKPSPFVKENICETHSLKDISKGRCLLLMGDKVSTDDISPGGTISENSEAGIYLLSLGVNPQNFNTYGSRRANHEVMVRGTFSSRNIHNFLVSEEGPITIAFPVNKKMSIYEAAEFYQKNDTPLIIIAGKDYGTGSSRDWAAKGPKLLGVRAIIAESFGDIHRANLVNMGIIPLQFIDNGWGKIGIDGSEEFNIIGLHDLDVKSPIHVEVIKNGITADSFEVKALIKSSLELKYLKSEGILNFSIKNKIDKERVC
ncbi:hypothetical protein ABE26_24875 [Cytobacillus firmus]|nr:hypothetical protein [Cytobacillus firmus]